MINNTTNKIYPVLEKNTIFWKERKFFKMATFPWIQFFPSPGWTNPVEILAGEETTKRWGKGSNTPLLGASALVDPPDSRGEKACSLAWFGLAGYC